MDTDLIQIAQGLGGQRVMLIGDLMLDRYVFGDAERISPEAPVPVLRAVDEEQRVGGAGSVAANLLALDLEVLCCGLVGHDEAGTQLLNMLQTAGASCEGIIAAAGRPTTTKTRLIGLAQHRHRQQLLRLDQEDVRPIPEAVRSQLLEYVGARVREVQVICIEDYNKGLIDAGLVAEIVALAAPSACPVLVDPAAVSDFSRYRSTTLLTPNRNELAAAVGRGFESLADMGEAATTLAAQLGLAYLVVTVDREGALLAPAGGTAEHIPTRPRAVYDNTGAGDAVLAMMAAALAVGARPRQAVQLANLAGGLEVEKFGCVPITRDEVLADLRIEQRRQVGKVRTLDELLGELTLRRDRGETVGFTNGCFDILHRGHVEYLRDCAAHASLLVVGVNTDASVRGQNKGIGRPFVAAPDRAAVVAALESVDYVVLFDEPTPLQLVEAIRPNVLMKGADWAEKGVVGRECVEAHGGRVELIALREGFSTTSVVHRIQQAEREDGRR